MSSLNKVVLIPNVSSETTNPPPDVKWRKATTEGRFLLNEAVLYIDPASDLAAKINKWLEETSV